MLAVLVSHGTALACAVCFDQDAESRVAFLATTALLTFLPLVLIGFGAWWWIRRTRELQVRASSTGDAAR